MLGRFFDKILKEDEEKELARATRKPKVKKKEKTGQEQIVELVLVFLLLLVPRLVYLFYISEPNIVGWYTDTFHHWQVAYLSKEIGFKQEVWRLWDFKGMEYFWGLLHPVVLAVLFALTGSINILVTRLLAIIAGCLAYVCLFVLMRRYFNRLVAWVTIIWTAFFPVTLFSNTIGEQEELGLLLIFGGMVLWPGKPVLTGILWALASMVRAEYWLFTVGLMVGLAVLRRHRERLVLVGISYGVVILAYMKHLVSHTGSWIFPIKLNFVASVKGEWLEEAAIVGVKLVAQRISRVIFGFGLLGGLLTLRKKPKQGLLWLFGFANVMFIGFMVGFGGYVKGFIMRIWLDRLYNWPYLFTGIVIISGLFYYLPKAWPWFSKLKLNWLIFIVGLGLSQWIWQPINRFVGANAGLYNYERDWAEEIAVAYQGGRVLIPEDRPYITYLLANDFGIEGKNMVGQMFDPFFYFEDQDNLFADWDENREIVIDWLKENDIRLIALTIPRERYTGLFEREPQMFKKLDSKRFKLYEVKVE